ncbi:MAG: hypothetical protein IT383_28340 [Deltaproteobacteria bacterium]|nr:hypothetical protein [Deltaproteobacteria bacterium]
MGLPARQEDVRAVMVAVLTPYLGRNMAQSSAKLYLERLGPVTAVGAAEVEQILTWMRPGLRVFAGEQRAALVLGELRAALMKLLEGA